MDAWFKRELVIRPSLGQMRLYVIVSSLLAQKCRSIF